MSFDVCQKMMKWRKWLIATLFTVFLCSAAAFVAALNWARGEVAGEGYDTPEAAWNYLVRSGEIRFRLLEGSRIESLVQHDKNGTITNTNEGFIRAGHGKFISTLTYRDNADQKKTLTFRTAKFNDWNRVLYVEEEDGTFSRYDNGVRDDSIQIHSNGEQGVDPNV